MSTRDGTTSIEYELNVQTMWHIEQMGILFRAILKLSGNVPSEVNGLARLGAYLADTAHNDVDLRNGELQPYYGLQRGLCHDNRP